MGGFADITVRNSHEREGPRPSCANFLSFQHEKLAEGQKMPRAAKLTTEALLLAAIILFSGGCTTLSQYIHNGFKVGPNLDVPEGDTAREWIDAADVRVKSENDDTCRWWTVFNDPTLDALIDNAAAQNLSLREAGFRILEARAQFGISVGNLFPQQQGGRRHFSERSLQSCGE